MSLLDTLVRHGAGHVVVSSGARCAPLVTAVSQTVALRVWTHPDERSAGFQALGIAKASRSPVILICTSGTAGANYLPAVIEACYTRVPIVVLTADRPPALRNTGAPQTIDQRELFGRFVLWSHELPLPVTDCPVADKWSAVASQAVRAALGNPQGPVHLNCPFDEPLVPEPSRVQSLLRERQDRMASVSPSSGSVTGCPCPDGAVWDDLAGRIRRVRRGIIICGPQVSCPGLAQSIERLSRASGYPVLADIASQVRWSFPAVIGHYDLFLGQRSHVGKLAPDLVLRFGGLPTSKALNLWLQSAAVRDSVLIDDHSGFADPYRSFTQTIQSPLDGAASELNNRLGTGSVSPGGFFDEWRAAETVAREVINESLPRTGRPFDGAVVRAVFEGAHSDTMIYLSNSMAIRWADAYAPAIPGPAGVLFNRGVNGIDGVVSSAVGAAAIVRGALVLVIGDIALLHDLNGLLGARLHNLDLKVVLLNNDGGGIFSFLPISAHQDFFDSLVAMPHGRDFSHAARFYGLRHTVLPSLDVFVTGYAACLSRPGPEMLEVRTDRKAAAEIHRRLIARITSRSGE